MLIRMNKVCSGKVIPTLTLKVPITTAADDKF